MIRRWLGPIASGMLLAGLCMIAWAEWRDPAHAAGWLQLWSLCGG